MSEEGAQLIWDPVTHWASDGTRCLCLRCWTSLTWCGWHPCLTPSVIDAINAFCALLGLCFTTLKWLDKNISFSGKWKFETLKQAFHCWAQKILISTRKKVYTTEREVVRCSIRKSASLEWKDKRQEFNSWPSSTARTKTTLLLLNLRFQYPTDPPPQYPK